MSLRHFGYLAGKAKARRHSSRAAAAAAAAGGTTGVDSGTLSNGATPFERE